MFPDWYKPWTFNYTSDGYLLLGFGVMAIFGYSYMNDIKEQKGRRTRKVFESNLKTNHEVLKERRLAVDRLAAKDPVFERYTHAKTRAAVHHH